MSRIYGYLLIFISLLMFSNSFSQFRYNRKDFGFGIIIGEPTGATIKYWVDNDNALVASIGSSYFGDPRLGIDYLWHFDAFNSRVVNLYAGPGGVIGFGKGGGGYWYSDHKDRFYYRSGSNAGLGIRGVFGLDVVPQRTPLEFFFEFGTLVGLAPDFGSAIDVAVGVRFYP
jgi:hypothetical protein